MKNNNTIKIAILAPFYPKTGGMAQLAINISKYLNNDGNNVSTINLNMPGMLTIFITYFNIIMVLISNSPYSC